MHDEKAITDCVLCNNGKHSFQRIFNNNLKLRTLINDAIIVNEVEGVKLLVFLNIERFSFT